MDAETKQAIQSLTKQTDALWEYVDSMMERMTHRHEDDIDSLQRALDNKCEAPLHPAF